MSFSMIQYPDASNKEKNNTHAPVSNQKPDVTEGVIESQQINTIAEKRVLRKVDGHIVPV